MSFVCYGVTISYIINDPGKKPDFSYICIYLPYSCESIQELFRVKTSLDVHIYI